MNDNILSNYMTFVEPLESPAIYQEWTCISTVASVAQRKLWLDPVAGSGAEGTAHYKVAGNLYIVLVGPPGIGKDTAMNVSRSLIEEVGTVQVKSDNITKEAVYLEMAMGMQHALLPGIAKPFPHCSLTVFSSEMSTLIKRADRDMVGALNLLFNTTDIIRNTTKGKGENIIVNGFLNILAGTTPDWVAFNVKEDVLEGGFAARTLFVFADKKSKLNPFPRIGMQERVAREKVMAGLNRVGKLAGEFTFTPDGRAAYEQWYHKHYSAPVLDWKMAGFHGRKAAFVQKVALIYAVMEPRNERTVTAEHIGQSLDILGRTEPLIATALKGVGRNDQHPYMARMLQQLREAGGKLPVIEWRNMNRPDFKPRELNETIEALTKDNRVSYANDEKGVTWVILKGGI